MAPSAARVYTLAPYTYSYRVPDYTPEAAYTPAIALGCRSINAASGV